MSTPVDLDTSASWTFHQYAVEGAGRRATIEKMRDPKHPEGSFKFVFPYKGNNVEVFVHWKSSKHDQLTGTYNWQANHHQAEIEFVVSSEGSHLEGVPLGFADAKRWILIKK